MPINTSLAPSWTPFDARAAGPSRRSRPQPPGIASRGDLLPTPASSRILPEGPDRAITALLGNPEKVANHA
ncbi:hypothetical protein [Kineococcus sp. SYSU DK003]|uniref:hypothetical protein n=1 Tax=Kineococcus sp. SYSU DK003 TaxID=3383124 RepID=UPI003D7E8A68